MWGAQQDGEGRNNQAHRNDPSPPPPLDSRDSSPEKMEPRCPSPPTSGLVQGRPKAAIRGASHYITNWGGVKSLRGELVSVLGEIETDLDLQRPLGNPCDHSLQECVPTLRASDSRKPKGDGSMDL